MDPVQRRRSHTKTAGLDGEDGGGLSKILVFLIVHCRMGMTGVGTWGFLFFFRMTHPESAMEALSFNMFRDTHGPYRMVNRRRYTPKAIISF